MEADLNNWKSTNYNWWQLWDISSKSQVCDQSKQLIQVEPEHVNIYCSNFSQDYKIKLKVVALIFYIILIFEPCSHMLKTKISNKS